MYKKITDENLKKYKEFGYKYGLKFTFSEDLALVKASGGKYGYINRDEELQIPCIYDDAYYFENGIARVKLDDETFFIDELGFVVHPTQSYKNTKLDETKAVCDAYFGRNLHHCIIDNKSYEFLPGKIDSLILIKNENGKFGYMDHHTHIIIPCIFDLATPFKEDQALVYYKKRWLYINQNGEFLLSKDNKLEKEVEKVK